MVGFQLETASNFAPQGHNCHMSTPKTQTAIVLYAREFGWTDLRMTLRSTPHIKVAGETDELSQARDLVARFRPDCVLASSRVDG